MKSKEDYVIQAKKENQVIAIYIPSEKGFSIPSQKYPLKIIPQKYFPPSV